MMEDIQEVAMYRGNDRMTSPIDVMPVGDGGRLTGRSNDAADQTFFNYSHSIRSTVS